MTPAGLAPPASTGPTPRPKHWTCDEFHYFGDLGAFEGRRAILIDGEILEEGPMNPPHALTVERVDAAIRAAFGVGWRFRIQLPLVLGLDTDPVPDFVVIAGGLQGVSNHPTSADLVIEVADSSLDFDSNEKRLLYARAGIRDYWVVDVNGRRLLVFRDPAAGDYSTKQTFGPNDAVTPLAATNAVKVAELLM